MEGELEAEEALTETEEETGEAFLKESLEKSGMGLRKEIDIMGWQKVESLAVEFFNFLDNQEEGLEVMTEFKAMLICNRCKRIKNLLFNRGFLEIFLWFFLFCFFFLCRSGV